MFGLSTELKNKGKLATVKRSVSMLTFRALTFRQSVRGSAVDSVILVNLKFDGKHLILANKKKKNVAFLGKRSKEVTPA